jgi:hypothetical protein
MDYGVLTDDERRVLMTLRAVGSWGFPYKEAVTFTPDLFRAIGRRLHARGYAEIRHYGTENETYYLTPAGLDASLTIPVWAGRAA